MSAHVEVLREVWRITERRDGRVFKTEFVEQRWVRVGLLEARPDGDPDLLWVPMSTGYWGKTIRTTRTEVT